MADIAELTNILSDAGAGTAPDKKIDGNAPGAGLTAFVYKDSSGNLILPQLNAQGAIIVSSSEDNGTRLKATAVTSAVVNTDVDAVTLTLVASKVYRQIQIVAANTRDTTWKLVHNDNGVPTTIAALGITGAGAFTRDTRLEDLQFTAGAVGTQQLKIVGKQIQSSASDLHTTLVAVQFDV